MKNIYFYILFVVLFLNCSNEKKAKEILLSPKISVATVTKLPKKVNETSGLIYFNQLFWTLNDSGGKPTIYGIDEKSGKIVKQVKIANARNIDWEDIAQDEVFIYIADTGNNAGKRQEFQIYKIAKSDILKQSQAKITVKATVITFKFRDLPKNLKTHNHNFDMESLVVAKGKLLIFTKNWANAKSTCYDISNGIAEKVTSYNPKGLLTGADYDPFNNRIIAIGYHKYGKITQFPPFLMIITDFNTPKEYTKTYDLPDVKGLQTEGICLKNNTIYISNEKNKKGEQSLKKIVFE